MISTITLRFGSSLRTRKMFSPPITSRRFTTTSRCSSMKACSRSGSRDTSVGGANAGNSAIASFSLWSRMASGALKTRAPSRTAADKSHVLATYSRSKGGSLRISTPSNSASRRTLGSCSLYQSSSFAVTDRRRARVATCAFAQWISDTRQHQISWPRAWAARIIATLESLYALSDSSGSMTKRSGNLLGLRDHVLHRGTHLGVGQRCVAALGRHGVLALQRILDERVHALLDPGRPGRLVAELRRAGDAGRMAGRAGTVEHLLAVGCCGLRGSAGGGALLRWLPGWLGGRSLRGGGLRQGRSLELRTCLVGEECHCASDVVVAERGIAAFRRHGAFPLERGLHERLVALLDARRPGCLVADLGRAGDTRLMAGRAHRLHDFLAAAPAGSAAAARAELDMRDRLQSCRDRIGRERAGIGVPFAGHELHDEHDADHRHEKGQQDHDDQLLRRLDERGMRVVRAHWGQSCLRV